ncbi:class I SAM-dependent methyltransferase [Prevotella veroralis]|uniref:Uncharacterized protein n=1 Tax=Prevotella veroralis F0319 TaxID=649761 RepID=C9MP04_9BACT|nr:class I SAM-dependent methyltransferase [Prevotella veroralis]EEX18807.1 hypothetical protein HMPREF0973_01342 [Prevotella veroralis F0319]QUB40644.1 RsmD family RNA methyltransferase [Prevotella veroralis]
MVKQQRNTLQQGEFPLPRYVQETLDKHNIPLPSPLGDGTGVRLLALQAHNYPDIDMPFLLNQLTGWLKARTKLPSWAAQEDIIYPPHLSMEQCSSEQTALYKTNLIKELSLRNTASASTRFVDLTGGFGVDFSFIARNFTHATYVERQEQLCKTAQHNFKVLGLKHAEVVNTDGTEYLHQMQPANVIFLDPARRNEQGGKTVLIEDCSPDVLTIEKELLQKADTIVLKLSPMLDWQRAVNELNVIGNVVREVHILSVRNECKELLIVLQKGETLSDTTAASIPKLRIVCVNDGEVVSYYEEETAGILPSILSTPPTAGQYLYEPNASLMKAGCFALISRRYEVSALSVNSHLFVSNSLIEHFPGRCFCLVAVSSFNKKELRCTLSSIKKANLAVRNFPMSVADLRKKLKIKEGGTDYLFATTDANNNHLLLICTKV